MMHLLVGSMWSVEGLSVPLEFDSSWLCSLYGGILKRGKAIRYHGMLEVVRLLPREMSKETLRLKFRPRKGPTVAFECDESRMASWALHDNSRKSRGKILAAQSDVVLIPNVTRIVEALEHMFAQTFGCRAHDEGRIAKVRQAWGSVSFDLLSE